MPLPGDDVLERALPTQPTAWLLLRVWLGLGLQSFGGGTATMYLIQRATVGRYQWLSDAEFTRDFAVCQLTPGINLLGLTILIGWRCRGILGVIVALTGLLLPSVTITIILTAIYTHVQQLALVQAAVRGVIPATIGLGAVLCWNMARPLLAQSRRQGQGALFMSGAVTVISALVALLFHPPVVVILLTAAGIGAITRVIVRSRA